MLKCLNAKSGMYNPYPVDSIVNPDRSNTYPTAGKINPAGWKPYPGGG
jgi:hypothetical protein